MRKNFKSKVILLLSFLFIVGLLVQCNSGEKIIDKSNLDNNVSVELHGSIWFILNGGINPFGLYGIIYNNGDDTIFYNLVLEVSSTIGGKYWGDLPDIHKIKPGQTGQFWASGFGYGFSSVSVKLFGYGEDAGWTYEKNAFGFALDKYIFIL